MKNEVQIIAPAGSFESLMAAIQGGASAVYFGVEHLNMRSRSASRFTLDELSEITKSCQENGVKAYLTLNAVLYNQDLALMRKICGAAFKAGVDAIIASDHAVMGYCRQIGMPLHISTQANISNIEALRFYAVYADVVVLARELSLNQVKEIVRQIKKQGIRGPSGELVKVEIFVHGALCMAISGKCYLNLHAHNASANRGSCFQNYRRAYHVRDVEQGDEWLIENEYIMSPKDLCTIGFIDKIIESGVTMLKIEGRGRAPEYVKTATGCYREAVDSCLNGSFTPERVAGWEDRLETVYNRGFWDGYYLGKKLGEWTESPDSNATHKKIYLGKCVKYFDKIEVAEFIMESYGLKTGDEILITGNKTGVIQDLVKELRVDGNVRPEAALGDRITLPLPEKIRPSDKLYKLVKTAS